ncbi:hypothetical protein L798_07757 [Zootermopsis nevadensis]|uniref:Uncharacterized protein n=1 Tax=Zootermopsis nevadensis TaxID=136037 RepID=A0A067RLW7_ZOONE|nr:hypothetical protein L798_07757 [Zootermopsis nevadensis]
MSEHFDKETVELIRHVLTTTHFPYDGSFYDQKDGRRGISSGPSRGKPVCGVMWQCRQDVLWVFLKHLNNIHPNITFTTFKRNTADLRRSDKQESRWCPGTRYIGSPFTWISTSTTGLNTLHRNRPFEVP